METFPECVLDTRFVTDAPDYLMLANWEVDQNNNNSRSCYYCIPELNLTEHLVLC
jgi:hypothetical protein